MACNFRLYSCLTERIICDGRHLGKRLGNLTLEGRAARLERKGGVVVFYDEKSVSRNSRTENFDAVKPAGHSDGWSVRAFDVFVAVLGLMFFAPILLAIAIAIKLDSRGPVFVREAQRGSNDGKIQVFRFRLVATRPQGDRSNPRLTWIGAILSGSGIDELPQLLNVLRGEISIARPRPVAYEQENSTKKGSKESANTTPQID